MVEHSHNHPNVKGFSPGATGRDKMAKNINKRTSDSSAVVEHSHPPPKVKGLSLTAVGRE